MRRVFFLIIMLLIPLQLIAQIEAAERSIYDLSNSITKVNGSVSKGSEIITMVSEKRVTLTSNITLHHRDLLYEDKSEAGSKNNFDDILLRKNGKIVYKYAYGNHPGYKVIRLSENEIVLIFLGGYQHDGDIEVFHVGHGTLTKKNKYKCENNEFVDMDHDGIDEMVIADSISYLIPEGGLVDSMGLWVVLKYENGFKYSPKLTKEKYRHILNIGATECDLEDKEKVEACKEVMEHIILSSYLGDFDSVAKAIRQNMIFHKKYDRIRFIKDFVDWFFDTQFIDEIKAYSGIKTPNEIVSNLIRKTGEHGQ